MQVGLFGLMTSAFSTTIQIPVVDRAWTFIGVPGYHIVGATSSTSTTLAMSMWKTSSGYEVITDDGTNNTATGLDYAHWDYNVTGSVSDASTPPSYSAVGSEIGDARYSTLGLMLIDTGSTGALEMVSINYYIKGRVKKENNDHSVSGSDYNETIPYRSMYIKSPDSATPDVKVIYRALYEGDEFRMRFDGSTTEIYKGYFSHDNTYDNPLSLTQITDESVTSEEAGSGTYRAIMDIFDMDLSDNNISRLSYIDPSSSGSSNTITKLTNAGDSNLTVLTWDSVNQKWLMFRANGNTGVNSASDFTELEAGRGYWVKLDTDEDSSYYDSTPPDEQPAGFLVGDNGITNTTTYSSTGTSPISDGWNMLSFNDEYIRESATGFILTTDNNKHFDDINITDPYSATTLRIDMSAADDILATHSFSKLNTIEGNCTVVNIAVEGNRSRGITPSLNVKCIPLNDGASGGWLLLSTRKFSIDVSNDTWTVKHLDGSTVTAETVYNVKQTKIADRFTSKYGDYVLFATLNTDFSASSSWLKDNFKPLPPRMSIVCPSVSDNAVGADLVNRGRQQSDARTAVDTALTSACNGGTVEVSLVDLNFDGTRNTLLMASTKRFYIRDNTFVRVFQWTGRDTNQSLVMIDGNDTAYFTTDTIFKTIKNDFNATIVAINEKNGTTGVFAFPIDLKGLSGTASDNVDLNKTFLAYSVSKSDWDLKETANGENFTDLAGYDDNASAVMGGIKAVYTATGIMDSGDPYHKNSSGIYTGTIDGNYSNYSKDNNVTTFIPLLPDLKYNAIWAPDMPNDGPLYTIRGLDQNGDQGQGTGPTGKKPELFITGETNASGHLISWKVIDVTRDPSTWYDTENQFDLFWTEKEQGYWVYIDGATTNPVIIGQATDSSGNTISFVTGEVVRHFQNYIGSAGVGTVFNHFDKTLTVDIKGLTDSTKLVDTIDTYNVEATIDGKVVPMFRTSGGTQFTLNLSDYETPGLTAGQTYDVVIRAADGIGNYATYSVSVDYSEPDTPTVTWNTDGTLTVESNTSTYIQVHDGNISDQNPSNSLVDTITGTGSTSYNLGSVSALEWKDANISSYTEYDSAAEQLKKDLIYDIRFVGVDGNNDSNSLYSDMRRLYYVPIYRGGHILSVDGTTTTDTKPKIYTEDGNSSSQATKDSGVQINSVSGYSFAIAYLGDSNASLTDGTKQAELKVHNSTGTDDQIGTIFYSPRYANKHFYVYYNSKMYVGFFKNGHDTVETITLYEVENSTQAITK
jgi:hypothetical protein